MGKKKIIYLVLILALFFSCGSEQEKVEKIKEDGVEVIVNHLEPYKIKEEPSNPNLEEELIIDFEREDLKEKGVKEVLGFDVDSEGNIYFIVSRSSEDLILKFDKKGDYLSSFGRRGQGPGELAAPRYLRVDELEQIHISDNVRNKLNLFEKNGDLIKEISLPSNYRITTLLGNGKFLAVKSSFIPEEGGVKFPIILCSEDFEEINMLHPGRILPNFTVAKKINGLQIYIDFNVLRISNRLIYVGNYGNGYEFLIYDTEGNLLRKIRKEYHKVKVPEQLKEDFLNWGKSFASFELWKGKVYFPKFHPPFQFFFLDEKSRLYVMTYERGKGPNAFMYDIFNPDGLFIGRIELENHGSSPFSITGIPVPLSTVAKNNRIYCLREKESGYKELVVYKMKWE